MTTQNKRDWLVRAPQSRKMERIEAYFGGHGYTPHRHDTYAIGVTEAGVQTFDYRGRVERSTPGQVVVLHPDEVHDGRAGTEAGFLRTRGTGVNVPHWCQGSPSVPHAPVRLAASDVTR